MRGKRSSWWVLLFVIAGAFIGNQVGEALGGTLPWLAKYGAVAVTPRDLTLLDLSFTFGLSLRINPAGALAALIGFVLSRRV